MYLIYLKVIYVYSWHVYNDQNREKVKKDESVARIEKEKSEERSKKAEREHRLSLLRSRASITINDSQKDALKSSKFELFTSFDGHKVKQLVHCIQ